MPKPVYLWPGVLSRVDCRAIGLDFSYYLRSCGGVCAEFNFAVLIPTKSKLIRKIC